MKRGLLVGSLVLSLGGWVSDLLAQEGAWRPATPGPIPVILVPNELKPCPAASLGRPIAVPNDPIIEPPPLILSPGVVQAAFHPTEFPPGVAAPTAKQIPGGDKMPTWADVEDEPNEYLEYIENNVDSGFASERWPLMVLPRDNAAPVRPIVTVIGASAQIVAPPSADGVPLIPPIKPPESDPFATLPPPTPVPVTKGEKDGDGMTILGDSDTIPRQMNPRYSHFYGNAEYLLWWIKKDAAPPLASTSTETAGSNAGALGQPGTSVLFGGPYGDDPRSGVRVSGGYWLDDMNEEAVEISGFYLAQRSTKFAAANSVLARPFFDVNSNSEAAAQVALPGVSTGSVSVDAPSNLWGLDANLRGNICHTSECRFDLLLGMRYMNLGESLDVSESMQDLAAAPAPFTNSLTTVSDRFDTRNQFYGGQIGLDSEWKHGPWSVDLSTKFALGATNQHVGISGSQSIVGANGSSTSSDGGLLALSSNSGSQSQTHFSFVPELGVTVGYQVTEKLRLYAGYNFLYWTNVVRPGEQIDRNINVTRIPNLNTAGATSTGLNAPAVLFKESDFWAQGVQVGFEFRY